MQIILSDYTGIRKLPCYAYFLRGYFLVTSDCNGSSDSPKWTVFVVCLNIRKVCLCLDHCGIWPKTNYPEEEHLAFNVPQ